MLRSPAADAVRAPDALADPSRPARREDVRTPRARLQQALVRWHWISAAASLVGMLLFAFTGVTLNHAPQIEGSAAVRAVEATVPTAILESLRREAAADAPQLSTEARRWLEAELDLDLRSADLEWSPDELYLSRPRPGGDAWASIDVESATLVAEVTDRGWLAYLNDLHKGRHTGAAWRWFLDLFALACVVFCITGLWLLALHAGRRPHTWPLVGLGLIAPVVLLLLLVH